MTNIVITEDIARNVLKVVDKGLANGIGIPRPGLMCVEAAVCYALGLPHSDDPPCVIDHLRSIKIRINDSPSWANKFERARGLRRLSIAQLGSAYIDESGDKVCTYDHVNFKNIVCKKTAEFVRPIAIGQLRRRPQDHYPPKKVSTEEFATAKENALKGNLTDAKVDRLRGTCDTFKGRDAINALYEAVSKFDTCISAEELSSYVCRGVILLAENGSRADRQKILVDYCELLVQALIKVKAPGTKWLYLTE